MQIDLKNEGEKLTVALSGRLDTTTSPELETKLSGALDGPKELVFDITELAYISSAGLRCLLSAQKKMNAAGGTMVVRGASEEVLEIFEVTGFTDILTIES